jgi:hypothetical protein
VAHRAVAAVGLSTTKSVPIAAGTMKGPFHPQLTKRSCKPFLHELLKLAVRDPCVSCRAASRDTVHRGLELECSKCHGSLAWKPASFDHDQSFVLDRDPRVEPEKRGAGRGGREPG